MSGAGAAFTITDPTAAFRSRLFGETGIGGQRRRNRGHSDGVCPRMAIKGCARVPNDNTLTKMTFEVSYFGFGRICFEEDQAMGFDKWVNDLLERRFEKIGLEVSYHRYFDARRNTKNNADITYLADNVDRIHNNTSSLLTHISAMIASLGIMLYIFIENETTQTMIFIEMAMYTFFAVVCVYNLRYRDFKYIEKSVGFENFIKAYYFNYLRRRYIYIICANGVLFTTIVFLTTVLWHILKLIL